MSTLRQPDISRELKPAMYGDLDGSAYYLLYLFNPSAGEGSESLPRAIHFVLDVSGSMGGPKLVDAKRAMLLILDLLSPSHAFPRLPSPSHAFSRLPSRPHRCDAPHPRPAHTFGQLRHLVV